MPPRELTNLLELLRSIDQRYRIFTVKYPPSGFDWCIATECRVFIARHVLNSPRLHEALAGILGEALTLKPRRALRLIRGGGDQRPGPNELRATGTTRY